MPTKYTAGLVSAATIACTIGLVLWSVEPTGASGHCEMAGRTDGYYYAGDTHFDWSESWIDTTTNDYSECLNRSQNFMIESAANVCFYGGGISNGQYGVGYARVSWEVWWNGASQGPPVQQQYDCGDVAW